MYITCMSFFGLKKSYSEIEAGNVKYYYTCFAEGSEKSNKRPKRLTNCLQFSLYCFFSKACSKFKLIIFHVHTRAKILFCKLKI